MDKQIVSGIYRITNAADGRFYVGSAKRLAHRKYLHFKQLAEGTHHNSFMQKAWRKYGAEAFRFEILLSCAPESLILYEQIAIDGLKPEYNIARIAGNTLGTKRSPETKALLSAKAKGRAWSDAAKAKVSATLTGRKMSEAFCEGLKGNQHAKGLKHTEEWKQANSVRMTGVKRPKSPEYRAKISAALKGRKATPESRAAQSAAQLGKKRGPYSVRKKGSDEKQSVLSPDK